MAQEFWIKKLSKTWPQQKFFYRVALTVSMNIWKVQQRKILIPDTTGIQWIIAVVTVSGCKVKWQLILNYLNTLDLLMSIPMRNTAVLKGVYLHSPPWNMNNQLVVSAQKFSLSTITVYHAYSEDNIRKLRSLLQRILACIMMVSFSQYKCVVWVFFQYVIIFIIAMFMVLTGKIFIKMFSIFFLFCIQLEHCVQRFILFILLKKSSGHKKHQ